MNVYIYYYVTPVSSAWHSGGGLVVIAESLDAARTQIASHLSHIEDFATAAEYDDHPLRATPDHTYELAGSPEPQVFTFSDAGCC